MAAKPNPIAEALSNSGAFGFGASSIGNLYKAISDESALATVDACWDHGLRYFDTAPFYGMGLSEQRLGEALRARPRDDFILSTKVGRLLTPIEQAYDQHGFVAPLPFEPQFDYSYDGVMRSFEGSLSRLGVGHIDIVYMHDIGRLTHGAAHQEHFQAAVTGGFRAMRELKDEGAVRAIGLGINEIEVCVESFAFGFLDVFMLAGRYSLLDHEPLTGFFDACSTRGTAIVGAGIFNSGILATGTKRGTPFYDYQPAPSQIIRRVAAIEAICEQFDVPLAAAALQFTAGHPVVATTVIGTSAPTRIAETVALAEQAIPPEFWAELIGQGLLPVHAPIPRQKNMGEKG